jgi:hypothetical protein
MSKLQVLAVDGSDEEVDTDNVTESAREIIGPTVRVTVKDSRLVMLVRKDKGGPVNPLATSIAGREVTGDAVLCERRFL